MVLRENLAQEIDEKRLLEYWETRDKGRDDAVINNRYHVFKILRYQNHPKPLLLIQWVGYSAEEPNATWEPLWKIASCAMGHLLDYRQRHNLQPNLRRKSSSKRSIEGDEVDEPPVTKKTMRATRNLSDIQQLRTDANTLKETVNSQSSDINTLMDELSRERRERQNLETRLQDLAAAQEAYHKSEKKRVGEMIETYCGPRQEAWINTAASRAAHGTFNSFKTYLRTSGQVELLGPELVSFQNDAGSVLSGRPAATGRQALPVGSSGIKAR